ncbi:hypothetical protein KAX17_08980 [Candidatus Bipolaricaulota bacterium]|nr:hypothetical protein [Candidatus Bipolaricaulota bacterium]
MRGVWVGIGLLLSLCMVLPSLADDSYISTASIFEFGASARTLGLGGAFVALADDEAAVFYNPAGLPQLSETRFSSLFTRPFGAYSYGVLGAAEQGWGGYLLILDSDTLEERDLYGNPIGSFRYTSTGLLLGWGHQVTDSLSLGLQVKGYGLAFPTQALGLALSPSVLFQEGPRSYGIVWRNLIATGTRFSDDHNEPWVSDMAVGLAWRFDKVTYCIDFTENLITRGDIRCVRMGYEYTGFGPLVLRAGTNRDWSSVGLSVQWKALRIDFAYLLHYALPDSYIVSLSYQETDSLTRTLSRAVRWLGNIIRQAF